MDFDQAFEIVVGYERGYVNDPADPGGETNWGISKRSYPNVDIKRLTREQAADIYRADFWIPIHGDELPAVVALQAVDFAVHSGPQTAIRYLQRALGVADDGYWGPVTKDALAAADPATLAMRYISLRLDFQTRLKNWPDAGKGWARRAAANLQEAADQIEGARVPVKIAPAVPQVSRGAGRPPWPVLPAKLAQP